MKYLLSMVLLAVAFTTQAAVIHLKNGDRLSGKILSEDDATVKIATALGELSVERSLISKLEDGTGDSASEASAASAKKATKPQVVAKPAESATKDWKAAIDLSTSLSRGNTDSDIYNLQANWSRQIDRSAYSADFSGTREELDGETVKDDILTDFGYTYHFTDDWYFALNAKYGRDPISGIDQQYSIHPAFGRHIWADSKKTLSIQAGTGYSWEETDAGDESSALVDWRLDFTYNFDSALSAFHKHHVYRNLSGRENINLVSQTGLSYKLSKDIQLKAQLNFDYDTEPVGGAEKDDLIFLIGAGVTL